MVERAGRVIVLCDSSKIGRSALSQICGLSDIDELITDVDAPAEDLQALRAAGLEVVAV
jgi:DeoR family transcriptional regulator of aga operon